MLFYYMGGAAARLDSTTKTIGKRVFSTTLVWIWSTLDPNNSPAMLQTVQQDLAAGNYRLLLQTAQSLYLIRPNQDGGQIPTLQIPCSQIRTLRRIPTNPGR